MTSSPAIYKPREYADAVWSHLEAQPRAGLLVGMGGGKTSLVLYHLSAMALTLGRTPTTLVIAPKRVANNVWGHEHEQWIGLGHLRVSVVLGTAEERKAALRKDADIYSINYENIEWLLHELDGAWPFECVVCDESTKLAGFRGSWRKHKATGKVSYYKGGTARAAELGRWAHKTKYWINLTGTFTSQGIAKAWGQTWFLDYGKALGGTYTAFTDKWFRQRIGTSKEAAVFEPWGQGAIDEILERIKPLYISIDMYKYFDVEKPNYIRVPIDMPDKLRKQYKALHDQSVLALSEETVITAVNAGAKINKCLQFTSGAMYDDDKIVHHIHDLKLDALESLVNELEGAPLIVAYWYKPEIDKILKKFPQAVKLDDKKETEDRWNRGEIPMLLVSPGSAAHGLSLQHGGNNMCIYTLMHSNELFSQLVERIGPIRQKQSGYERLCNVYLLECKGTWDEKIWASLMAHQSFEQMVKDVLDYERTV
jgi:hypothetical protein